MRASAGWCTTVQTTTRMPGSSYSGWPVLQRVNSVTGDLATGVEEQVGTGRDGVQVVLGVRLEQDRQVGLVGRAGGLADVLAVPLPAVHVRVVEAEHRAALPQLAGDRAGRALPLVGDVLLVGDAQEQHPRAV